MKFYFAMEKIMFTFFLFTGEIKWKFNFGGGRGETAH